MCYCCTFFSFSRKEQSRCFRSIISCPSWVAEYFAHSINGTYTIHCNLQNKSLFIFRWKAIFYFFRNMTSHQLDKLELIFLYKTYFFHRWYNSKMSFFTNNEKILLVRLNSYFNSTFLAGYCLGFVLLKIYTANSTNKEHDFS